MVWKLFLFAAQVLMCYSAPVNQGGISFYEAIKSTETSDQYKCPMLRSSSFLEPKPSILETCDDFNRASNTTVFTKKNEGDALCLLFFNSYHQLCATTNTFTKEQFGKYFTDKSISKGETIDEICKNFKNFNLAFNATPAFKTVIKSLNDNDKCKLYCEELDTNPSGLCKISSYMIALSNKIRQSGKTNEPKVEDQQVSDRETLHRQNLGMKDQNIPGQYIQDKNVEDQKETQNSESKNPNGQREDQNKDRNSDDQTREGLSRDVNREDLNGEGQYIEKIDNKKAMDTLKAAVSPGPAFDEDFKFESSPAKKPSSTEPHIAALSDKLSKMPNTNAKTSAEKVSASTLQNNGQGDQRASANQNPSHPEQPEIESKAISGMSAPAIDSPKKTGSSDAGVSPIGNFPVKKVDPVKTDDLSAPKYNPNLEAPTENGKPVSKDLDEKKKVAQDLSQEQMMTNEQQGEEEMNVEDSEEMNGLDNHENYEDIKQIPAKPVSNLKPSTVGDDSNNSNIYATEDIEGESYFFSYFMTVCVIFVLCYVGYHNKQKILALVLEGRRGKRPQRSRRPNSANYHKLDSNLEEAVTSSCSKNTTQIIY